MAVCVSINHILCSVFFLHQSEDLKKRGNEALGEGNTAEAIQLYSQAIEVAPDNHVLYSNRCAAYMKAEEYEKALADAQETVRLKKDWPKVRLPLHMRAQPYQSLIFSLRLKHQHEPVYVVYMPPPLKLHAFWLLPTEALLLLFL